MESITANSISCGAKDGVKDPEDKLSVEDVIENQSEEESPVSKKQKLNLPTDKSSAHAVGIISKKVGFGCFR